MPTSDSEDFESADEGQGNIDKKERKKRHSSSNYSDNALENESNCKQLPQDLAKTNKLETKDFQGWDDFDIEQEDEATSNAPKEQIPKKPPQQASAKSESKQVTDANTSEDTGWDDFGDWGDEQTCDTQTAPQKMQSIDKDHNIKEVTDRLAATTTSNKGWGWGWGGVDSLLSTATAGITTITSQVSQGISTVLETGMGVPDPEELARQTAKETKERPRPAEGDPAAGEQDTEKTEGVRPEADDGFAFSSILNFVGDAGSKVLSHGLNTLETIGRKTMEVLEDGDPRLARKRALLGLDPDSRPILSQVLREAKAKADEDDRIKEEKREAKEVHYENLFDDFEGLVHLEALEMVSKQVGMRIEERIRSATPEKRQEIKETLQQVTELCEMPDEDDEDEDEVTEGLSKQDELLERLQRATKDLGVKLHFQPLVKQYKEVLEWSSTTSEATPREIYKLSLSHLARATALCVQLYHKGTEMLLVKTRRSTADEADSLTQMTVVLTKHTSELARIFTEKMNSIAKDDDNECKNYITNIYLEAGNSSTYIQNAFLLAQPVIQIGAV